MAFFSINRAIVKEKAREGEKHAIILDRLLQNTENVINAIVIGNNLVNILASIFAGTIVTIIFGNIGIGIATVVMILLIIIFGESTPKSFGIQNMRFALRVARPLAFITKIFHPVVLLLTSISNVLIRLVGGKVRS
jgi:magnesium and cobalt exporter, CNNM family